MAENGEFLTPEATPPQQFHDTKAAVAQLIALYDAAVGFLKSEFARAMAGTPRGVRVRAFYPMIRIETSSFAKIDSRLSFGHVPDPGVHVATITRPRLFAHYLEQQIGLLIENHGVPVEIGLSDTPMPVHFAVAGDDDIEEAALPHRRNAWQAGDRLARATGAKPPEPAGAFGDEHVAARQEGQRPGYAEAAGKFFDAEGRQASLCQRRTGVEQRQGDGRKAELATVHHQASLSSCGCRAG